MHLRYLLFAILSLFCYQAFAQTNFKPGYVVTLKGDTLKGDVDYREWVQTPQSIRFKNSSGQVSTYSTNNTTAFGIDQMEYFERLVVPISMDETAVSKLSTGIDSAMVTNTLFAHVLTKGKYLALYSYNDNIKTRYIVKETQNGQPRELSYHIYIDPQGSDMKYITTNGYRIQLIQYTYKYNKFTPQLNDRILRINYNDDIIGIVNLVNGETAHKIAGNAKAGSRFFIGTAVNAATLKYSGDVGLSENPEDKVTYFPELNMGMDFFINASIGRLILRGELGLTSGNLTTSSHLLIPTHVMEQHVTQRTVYLSPQLIYNFYHGQQVSIFMGTGFRLNLSAYPKNEIHSTDTQTGSVYFSATDFPPMTRLWYQIPIKAGLTINNKLQFFGQYLLLGTATSPSYGGKITSAGIGFNYLFGIK